MAFTQLWGCLKKVRLPHFNEAASQQWGCLKKMRLPLNNGIMLPQYNEATWYQHCLPTIRAEARLTRKCQSDVRSFSELLFYDFTSVRGFHRALIFKILHSTSPSFWIAEKFINCLTNLKEYFDKISSIFWGTTLGLKVVLAEPNMRFYNSDYRVSQKKGHAKILWICRLPKSLE